MKILVIEDDPRHLEDAKNFFSSTEKGKGADEFYVNAFKKYLKEEKVKKIFSLRKNLDVIFACDYREAFRSENNPKKYLESFDGVISDIYFPLNARNGRFNNPEPIGVVVSEICREIGIPCVLITDGYHHGPRFEWINVYQQMFGRPNMIDITHLKDRGPLLKKGSKRWDEAFLWLMNWVMDG